jgi:hypothetical protein
MKRLMPLCSIFAVAHSLIACVAFSPAAAGECDWLGGHGAVHTIVSPSLDDTIYLPFGYDYPYVLYVPRKPAPTFPYLLVEPNNPGVPGLSAKQLLLNAVEAATINSLGHSLADRLNAPLLVPALPRPKTEDGISNVYTHSLSREAMLISSGPLYRVDLQLEAMSDQARAKLASCGISLNNKIMIDGFSASGVFAGRFVFLHPKAVLAAAFGGVCGFLTLPTTHFHGRPVSYPIGAFDYERFTGRQFDKLAFDAVSQFAFIGKEDLDPQRDCLRFRDSYDPSDALLIYEFFGQKMNFDRWDRVQAAFKTLGSSILFKPPYDNLGHDWNDTRLITDVVNFFKNAAQQAQRH